jgi:hypothetical protein
MSFSTRCTSAASPGPRPSDVRPKSSRAVGRFDREGACPGWSGPFGGMSCGVGEGMRSGGALPALFWSKEDVAACGGGDLNVGSADTVILRVGAERSAIAS